MTINSTPFNLELVLEKENSGDIRTTTEGAEKGQGHNSKGVGRQRLYKFHISE